MLSRKDKPRFLDITFEMQHSLVGFFLMLYHLRLTTQYTWLEQGQVIHFCKRYYRSLKSDES